MMTQRHFRISSAREQFVKIYAVIAELVEELGLQAEDKFRFAVCVTEAFTNAFYHGNQCDPEKCVDLLFSWDESELSLEISDEGKGRKADLDIVSNFSEIPPEKTSGRGIAIMNKFADKLQVSDRDGSGLQVKLSWQRRTHTANKTPAM